MNTKQSPYLSVDDARQRILDAVTSVGTERVLLDQSLGRTLAKAIACPIDWPRFDNSAMDGVAMRAADLAPLLAGGEVSLPVAFEVPAGSVAPRPLMAGEACRIMTGAQMPEGADTVVMREETRYPEEGVVEVLRHPGDGANVRRRGGDLSVGDVALEAGARIDPGAIGLLASFARSQVSVFRRPRVAIVSTGDELVELDQTPGEGQIVNSSGFMIAAQVREAGGIPIVQPIVRDDLDATRRAFEEALKSADLVVSMGGVSVGDHDHVKAVIESLSDDVHFWKIAIKPGKPLAFGRCQGTPLIGLPGNPVSSFVTFLQFVRPALLKMGGAQGPWGLPRLRARLSAGVKGARFRQEFIRGHLSCGSEGLEFAPHQRQGSGNIHSVSALNAFGVLAPGAKHAANEVIDVELYGPLS